MADFEKSREATEIALRAKIVELESALAGARELVRDIYGDYSPEEIAKSERSSRLGYYRRALQLIDNALFMRETTDHKFPDPHATVEPLFGSRCKLHDYEWIEGIPCKCGGRRMWHDGIGSTTTDIHWKCLGCGEDRYVDGIDA